MNRWSVPRRYRTRAAALSLGFCITLLLAFTLHHPPSFVDRAERGAYDWQFQYRGSEAPPADVVIVGLDDSSIAEVAQGRYPVPRCSTARVVDVLRRAGAAAIALDFLYSADSAFGHQDDVCLSKAIRRAGNVVLAMSIGGALSSNFVAGSSSLNPPIDLLTRSARGLGIVNFPLDSDQVIRRAILQQRAPGSAGTAQDMYPSLAVQLISVASRRPPAQVLLGKPNSLYIDYVGPQDPGNASQQSFRTYQFASVAAGQVDPGLFRNKMVIVVPASIVTKDLLQTPFGTMFGGYVEANTVHTITSGLDVSAAGDDLNTALLVLVGVLTTLAAASVSMWKGTAIALALGVGNAVSAIVAFQVHRTWINLIQPEAAIILAFAAVMALRFATEERQKRLAHRIFGQYVKPEIVDILVNESTPLDGARRMVTVLFVDVRGFTAMSETLEPEEVVSALDVYLEELTESIQLFDGTLDKYVGDELMAIWNAPRLQDEHAVLAVQSALDMVRKTDRINAQLQSRGLSPIGFGVGINSGEAVVGQMGSSFRKQYTVIGDTVNTGARLCSAAARGEIVIGPCTRELIGNQFIVHELEPIQLKGKSEPFRCYSVTSHSEEI